LVDLAFSALPAIGGAVGFVGFVAVIGGAIQWVRFEAAGLPANQAVQAASRNEFLVTGAWSLSLFVFLGLLAVVVAYLGRSRGAGTTGWGFYLLAGVEALVAFYIVDGWRACVILIGWLAAVAVLAAWQGALEAWPAVVKEIHGRQLLAARHRWEDANGKTTQSQEWLDRLAASKAPPESITEANGELTNALRALHRAEMGWTALVDRLSKRYEP
jgi:hypothetical protein